MQTHVNHVFNLSAPYCLLGKGGVGFGRTVPFYQCFMVDISGGVGRFVPVVMVVERGDATGAWYWKGSPTRTLVFERQNCIPGHKSSKEWLTVMCCGNTTGSHKLKLVVNGKTKESLSFKGTVKLKSPPPPVFQLYYTAHGPRSDCVYETTLPG
jgi:hypothetical protein